MNDLNGLGLRMRMNVMTKCSLCDQEFDTSDPLIEVRKHRHVQGMHTAHIIYSERDGSPSKPMGNHTYGEVTWS